MKKIKLLLTIIFMLNIAFCVGQEKKEQKKSTVTGMAGTQVFDEETRRRVQNQRDLEEYNRQKDAEKRRQQQNSSSQSGNGRSNSGSGTNSSSRSSGKSEWGPWITDPCFRGVQYRVKFNDSYSEQYGWFWYIDFKNTYSQEIAFNFTMGASNSEAVENTETGKGQFRTSIKSGKTDGGNMWKHVQNQNEVFVLIGYLRFIPPGKIDVSLPYEKCDGGTYICNFCNGDARPGCANYGSNGSGDNGSSGLVNNSGKTAEQKAADDAAEKAQKEADDKADRERKAAEEKANNYNDYMSKGNSALSDEKFDDAINYYNTAANYASGEGDINAVNEAIARARKLKADAARKVRVEEELKREEVANNTTVAATTATVGLMALLNDGYSDKPFSVKFLLGVGMEGIHLNVNETFKRNSATQRMTTFDGYLGFNATVFNNKGISLELSPFFNYGLIAFQTGYSGGKISYGGSGTLYLSKKSTSKIKLFAEGGYIKRSGDLNFDQDVANGNSATSTASATDIVQKGEYNYSVLKYGGGFMLRFVHQNDNDKWVETTIKPGFFFEKPSFALPSDKPIMVANLQLNIESIMCLDVSYSKNYAIGGKINYPQNYKLENGNYWNFRIIRKGKLL
jgi:hypothetical protein